MFNKKKEILSVGKVPKMIFLKKEIMGIIKRRDKIDEIICATD
jgi:hypothetical protein